MNELKNAKHNEVFIATDGTVVQWDADVDKFDVIGDRSTIRRNDSFIANRTWTKLEPVPELGEPINRDIILEGHYVRRDNDSGKIEVLTIEEGECLQIGGCDYWRLPLPGLPPIPEQKPKLPEPPNNRLRTNPKARPTMNDEKLINFGKQMLELTKDCIRDGAVDADVEGMANVAIECGLIAWVPYDPEKHGEMECEVEDKIYWWGDIESEANGE